MLQAENVEEKLKQVFCDVFRLRPEEINDSLTPDDVPDWDSMQHLNLVVSIEERFDVALSPDEIEALRAGFGAAKKVLAAKGVS